MLGKFSRGFLTASLIGLLSACSSTGESSGDLPSPYSRSHGSGPVSMFVPSAPQTATDPSVPPVVQAYCPKVALLDQTAVYRAYAKGGQDNADKLLYQASLADSTRQCTANETTMTINVMVQGRIVEGPAGAPGQTTLPLLVQVVDGDKVIYSQKVAYPVTIPAGGGQFLFEKADVQIPNAVGGASRFATVQVGFDTGPAKKPAKPNRRG